MDAVYRLRLFRLDEIDLDTPSEAAPRGAGDPTSFAHFAATGGLMSYGGSQTDEFRRVVPFRSRLTGLADEVIE